MGLGRFRLLLEQPRDLPFDLDEPVASLIIKRAMEWRLHEMDEKPNGNHAMLGKSTVRGVSQRRRGPRRAAKGWEIPCWGKRLLTAFTSHQATIPLGPLFLILQCTSNG